MSARIAILAQDLIWSERLAGIVEAVGGVASRSRDVAAFERSFATSDFAIVDLTAVAYDPLAAIELASTAGLRVIAVGQHDDVPIRKQALARGAERVFAYRKLFEDGPATVAGWLARGATADVAR